MPAGGVRRRARDGRRGPGRVGRGRLAAGGQLLHGRAARALAGAVPRRRPRALRVDAEGARGPRERRRPRLRAPAAVARLRRAPRGDAAEAGAAPGKRRGEADAFAVQEGAAAPRQGGRCGQGRPGGAAHARGRRDGDDALHPAARAGPARPPRGPAAAGDGGVRRVRSSGLPRAAGDERERRAAAEHGRRDAAADDARRHGVGKGVRRGPEREAGPASHAAVAGRVRPLRDAARHAPPAAADGRRHRAAADAGRLDRGPARRRAWCPPTDDTADQTPHQALHAGRHLPADDARRHAAAPLGPARGRDRIAGRRLAAPLAAPALQRDLRRRAAAVLRRRGTAPAEVDAPGLSEAKA